MRGVTRESYRYMLVLGNVNKGVYVAIFEAMNQGRDLQLIWCMKERFQNLHFGQRNRLALQQQ